MRPWIVPAIAAWALAGCGGGGSGVATGAGSSPTSGSTVKGSITLAIPVPAQPAATARKPSFVSPGAVSAGITIDNGPQTYYDVSATSPNCTTSNSVRTCSLAVGAPTGASVNFIVELYPQANGGGAVLSVGSSTIAVVAGTPFSVTIALAPNAASLVSLSSTPSWAYTQSNSTTITPTFADASGQTITGTTAYATPVHVSSSDPHVTVSAPATATLLAPAAQFTLRYDGSAAVASTVTITYSTSAQIGQTTISLPGLANTAYNLGADFTKTPEQLVVGSDNNIYWAENSDNLLGQINPNTGAVQHFATGFTSSPFPDGVAAGGDGNIWINDGNCLIQRISTSGSLVGSQISVGASGCSLTRMMVDGSGDVWFLDTGLNHVGEIDKGTFAVSTFSPSSGAFNGFGYLASLTLGPDGAIYFTENGGLKIGRVTTAATAGADGHALGYIQEYAIPNTTASIFPTGITAGPDGNLWFLVFDNPTGQNQFFAKFAPVTPPATIDITEYPGVINYNAFANLVAISPGPDGNLWIANGGAGIKIPPANPTAALQEAFTCVCQYDVHSIIKGPDGNVWFDGFGSSGGGGFNPTQDAVNKFAPR